MKKIKSTITYIIPRSIILGLSLFNFFYIYSKIPHTDTQTGGKISFYYREWHETSDFVDVLVLLVAALLLAQGKKWGYLSAIVLSGIIVVEGLIQYVFRISLLEVWKYVQKNELDILLQWEMQFILSLIIFITATFYLIRETTNRTALR